MSAWIAWSIWAAVMLGSTVLLLVALRSMDNR